MACVADRAASDDPIRPSAATWCVTAPATRESSARLTASAFRPTPAPFRARAAPWRRFEQRDRRERPLLSHALTGHAGMATGPPVTPAWLPVRSKSSGVVAGARRRQDCSRFVGGELCDALLGERVDELACGGQQPLAARYERQKQS